MARKPAPPVLGSPRFADLRNRPQHRSGAPILSYLILWLMGAACCSLIAVAITVISIFTG